MVYLLAASGTVQMVYLLAASWTDRFPVGGSEVHQASYSMGTGGSFSGIKRQARVVDHSPLISSEAKITGIYTFPTQGFML
jgi:hypothetical protein